MVHTKTQIQNNVKQIETPGISDFHVFLIGLALIFLSNFSSLNAVYDAMDLTAQEQVLPVDCPDITDVFSSVKKGTL